MKSPNQSRPTSSPKAVTMVGGVKCGDSCSTNRVTPTKKTVPTLYNPPKRPLVGYYGGSAD